MSQIILNPFWQYFTSMCQKMSQMYTLIIFATHANWLSIAVLVLWAQHSLEVDVDRSRNGSHIVRQNVQCAHLPNQVGSRSAQLKCRTNVRHGRKPHRPHARARQHHRQKQHQQTLTPPYPVSDMDRTESDIQQHATPAYQAGKPLQPERFIDRNVVKRAQCPLCQNVMEGAVLAACCEKMFYCACICNWLQQKAACPKCTAPMQASELEQPNNIVCGFLQNFTVHYEPAMVGCPVTVVLRSLQQHVSDCSFNPATPAMPIRAVSASSLVGEVPAGLTIKDAR